MEICQSPHDIHVSVSVTTSCLCTPSCLVGYFDIETISSASISFDDNDEKVKEYSNLSYTYIYIYTLARCCVSRANYADPKRESNDESKHTVTIESAPDLSSCESSFLSRVWTLEVVTLRKLRASSRQSHDCLRPD